MTALDEITAAEGGANNTPSAVRRDELRDDIANADRFAADSADWLRHVATFAPSWHLWDGCRWAPDETGAHMELAKETADRLLAEADGPEAKRAKHAKASRNAWRLRAMVMLAQSDPLLARRPADFDPDPWLLNTTSGTLDLRTRELRPHDPADGITKLTGAAFRPDATAPTWDAFLRRIFDENDELEAFVRRLVGAASIGVVRDHLLAILWGTGANGKTTLANAVDFALGDYAHTATVELLLGRHRPGAATPELADLRGRRLVTASEILAAVQATGFLVSCPQPVLDLFARFKAAGA